MNYENLSFHPTTESVVDILRERTQNEDHTFFFLMVSYHFAKVASMMRVHVNFAKTQEVPVNMYAVNLAPSGFGKGHSTSIIEDHLIGDFRTRFLGEVFPKVAEKHLAVLANARAHRNQTSASKEFDIVQKEFEAMGELLFAFDSATTPAIKQMRNKLLMAGIGSMNLEIDEIGSNLLGNTDALNTYLELFDAGRLKPKLIKNTKDSVRTEDLVGCSPANMMLFGTPSKLLDGTKTEEEFYTFLETGYARRCFFGCSRRRSTPSNQTAKDLLKTYNDKQTVAFLGQTSDQIKRLAGQGKFQRVLEMDEDVSLALMEYRLYCQRQADKFPEHEELKRAEMAHRYFKAAKLAAVYAFIDGETNVPMEYLEYALAVSELSGDSFHSLLTRDRPHVKLAHYIAAHDGELTQADLTEDLPYFKGSKQHIEQLMSLAIAHGYREGIYITKEEVDGIPFYNGKKLEETDLSKILVSFSKHIAEGYVAKHIPWNKIHQLTQASGYHWINHKVKDGHRKETNVISGCNILVLDVENSISLDMAKALLKDYTYHIYTTKRHTESDHRYRIVLPLSHYVELDAQDFKAFMKNVFDWLPFSVDSTTGQRARKWLSHKGQYWYNKGELIDALQFVPKTKKAEEYRNRINSQTNLTALEKWFINQAPEEGRNNQLIKYVYALLDGGRNMDQIREAVFKLNNKFDQPLDEAEIEASVLNTAQREFNQRSSNNV